VKNNANQRENPKLPVLEHEFTSEAKIEPSRVIRPGDVPEVRGVSFFREIIEKVAVAQFRHVTPAQLLYAGDDLSGDERDHAAGSCARRSVKTCSGWW